MRTTKNPTPKPIRCWAVYDNFNKYIERVTDVGPDKNYAHAANYTIIPGRFVPDKPKKRKRK